MRRVFIDHHERKGRRNCRREHQYGLRFTGKRWFKKWDPKELAVEKARRIGKYLHTSYKNQIGSGDDYIDSKNQKKFEEEKWKRFVEELSRTQDILGNIESLYYPSKFLSSPDAYFEIHGHTKVQKPIIAYDQTIGTKELRSIYLCGETNAPSSIDEMDYYRCEDCWRNDIADMKNTAKLVGKLVISGSKLEYKKIRNNLEYICKETIKK